MVDIKGQKRWMIIDGERRDKKIIRSAGSVSRNDLQLSQKRNDTVWKSKNAWRVS